MDFFFPKNIMGFIIRIYSIRDLLQLKSFGNNEYWFSYKLMIIISLKTINALIILILLLVGNGKMMINAL